MYRPSQTSAHSVRSVAASPWFTSCTLPSQVFSDHVYQVSAQHRAFYGVATLRKDAKKTMLAS